MTDRFAQTLGGASGILYVVLLMAGGSLGGPASQLAYSLEVLAFTSFLFDVLVGVMHRGHQHPTARPWEKQHAESPTNTPAQTGAVGGRAQPWRQRSPPTGAVGQADVIR